MDTYFISLVGSYWHPKIHLLHYWALAMPASLRHFVLDAIVLLTQDKARQSTSSSASVTYLIGTESKQNRTKSNEILSVAQHATTNARFAHEP